MLKISAIVLIALGVVVVSGCGRLPSNRLMPKKVKNGKHTTNPVIVTSNILRSILLQIFTDCKSCGNDFNTWILYHGK